MNAKQLYRATLSWVRVAIIKLFHFSKFSIKGIPVSAPFCFTISKGYVEIGRRVNILKGTHIAAVDGGKISIGDSVYINRNCEIISRENISIGNGCRFGPNVCIYDHNHRFDYSGVKDEYKTGKVVIGNGCWLAANSVVLKGCTIGDGCVIGAGVVVRTDIPSHTLVISDKEMIPIQKKD